MHKRVPVKPLVFVIAGIGITVLLFAFMLWPLEEETEIATEWLDNTDTGAGSIVEGKNNSSEARSLRTTDRLTFESQEITTTRRTNAVVLQWGEPQQDDEAGAHAHDSEIQVQMRTFDGAWSDWVDINNEEDRKDGTPAPQSALVLADVIDRLQYRIILEAEDDISSTVNLDDVTIQQLDTTKGPSPDKPKNRLHALISWMNDSAHALAVNPPIVNRAGWGSPEPNGSPRWTPEYVPLHQVIVHHTATTTSGDPSADIRAIWHYHANTLGWGDIGYNYIVDRKGRIYWGRYFDPSTARQQGGDVVAGHALNHNRGTTGIAILGNYSNNNPSGLSEEAVARISGYKAAPYGFNPVGGSKLVGHRNVTQTACPGDRLYGRLAYIRQRAKHYYNHYRHYWRYDYAYRGQGYNGKMTNTANMVVGERGTVHIDLQNTGMHIWRGSGNKSLNLATARPRDHLSIFNTNDWLSPNRAATITHKVTNGGVVETDTIQHGETARFYFDVRARKTGSYQEYFQPVRENMAWFRRNLGVFMRFNVEPKRYGWQFISKQAYTDDTKSETLDISSIAPGQRFYLEVRAKNTGNWPWRADSSAPARLATTHERDRHSPFCDSTWLSCNRPTAVMPSPTEAGDEATFEFWATAPAEAGTYTERFNVVLEGNRWLKSEGLRWVIRVE